jgi:D-beta-D-heptose 7-phosphate kinase / D-beta-D-heptose 1-phosphate adenosyltransferase
MTEVLVTGTFNIVHPDHVALLEFASRYGKVVVGINGDAYVTKKYGDRAVPLYYRAYVLRSCKFVEDVVVFPEDEPSNLIRKLNPMVYVKGPDYRDIDIPEQGVCDELGVRVVYRTGPRRFSSSELLNLPSESLFAEIDYLDIF